MFGIEAMTLLKKLLMYIKNVSKLEIGWTGVKIPKDFTMHFLVFKNIFNYYEISQNAVVIFVVYLCF